MIDLALNPGLLKQCMELSGQTEQWVTVHEFHTYFHPDEGSAHALFRISAHNLSASVINRLYNVARIEKSKERRRIEE
jgi:hypothetical protein